MQLLAISVAGARTITVGGRAVETGIYKAPVTGPVWVGPEGVAGDLQVDRENHGGEHLAVYSYPHEHYPYWAGRLGRPGFPFGQFGENLTVAGLTEDNVHIGDVFRIGGVWLEVTQPRVPCFKLGHRMERMEFVAEFGRSGRVGFYQRVVQAGEIRAGDVIERVSTDPRRVTVRELMLWRQYGEGGPDLPDRVLAVPALTPAWRVELAERVRANRAA